MVDQLLSPIHCITTQPPLKYGGANEYEPQGKEINKYSLDGELVDIISSQKKAAEETGLSVATFSARIKRGDNIIDGFRWERKDQHEKEK